MFCNQRRLLRRLVVDNPQALKSEPWRLHIRGCKACWTEKTGFDRSLAVFRQIEIEEREQKALGPTWEAFSTVMAADQRARKRFRLRVSLAAAAAATLVFSGGALWQSVLSLEPQPAKIVSLDSSQRSHLMRVMQASLSGPAKVRFVMNGWRGSAAPSTPTQAVESTPVMLPAQPDATVLPVIGELRLAGQPFPYSVPLSMETRSVLRPASLRPAAEPRSTGDTPASRQPFTPFPTH